MVEKTVVAGAKDRRTTKVSATVVNGTDAITLQAFVEECEVAGARVCTEDHRSYLEPFFEHERVRHGSGECVKGSARMQGMRASG